jgi:RNA polymerase sigma-70 factor (ECF subfamily)
MSRSDTSPPDLDHLLNLVARNRDIEAFAEIFRTFGTRLVTYFERLGHDARTAEDLAQEVMLIVWHRASTYRRDIAPASAWIFTIARNRRIDHLRSLARELTDDDAFEVLAQFEPPADEALQNRLMAEKLSQALKKLPKEQSNAILSSYFDHKSQSEIAAACDVPLGTIKSRMRLGLNRLRTMIEED